MVVGMGWRLMALRSEQSLMPVRKGQILMVADKLASQTIGGYIGLHSTRRKYCQCTATGDVMPSKLKLNYKSNLVGEHDKIVMF